MTLLSACDTTTDNDNQGADELTLRISSESTSPTSVNPIPVDFTFSREVTGFAEEDIHVTNGFIDNFNVTNQSEYTAQIIPDDEGEVAITVDAGAAEDLSGNLSLGAEFGITYDSNPPDDVVLQITSAGEGNINLTWDFPDEPDYDHLLVTWIPGGEEGIIVPGENNAVRITGLTASVEYTITAVAFDTALNSSAGSSIAIIMPELEASVHFVADEDTLVEYITLPDNWGDHYILEDDLDLGEYDADGSGWEPIGTQAEPFNGTFNGNGHIIRNLTINNPTMDYQGFFGYVDTGARIENLVFENVDITGKNYIGTVAGSNSGTISACSVSGTVEGVLGTSGLVGWNITGAIITNSHTDVTVHGLSSITSGLTGINQGTISSCSATGPVSGVANSAGLVGANHGIISDSFASGAVTGTNNVGGLVVQNYSTGSIVDSFATGNVSGEQMTAGLVADSAGDVSGCYATGIVTGSSYTAGGLFARITDGTVEDCYSRCAVSGTQQVGGISAVIYPSTGVTVIISRCYETGTVSGTSDIGGFVGRISVPAQVSVTTCIFNNANTDNGYGTAATLADMRSQTTFSGWDFTDVWAIDGTAAINNGYPYLRAIPPTP